MPLPQRYQSLRCRIPAPPHPGQCSSAPPHMPGQPLPCLFHSSSAPAAEAWDAPDKRHGGTFCFGLSLTVFLTGFDGWPHDRGDSVAPLHCRRPYWVVSLQQGRPQCTTTPSSTVVAMTPQRGRLLCAAPTLSPLTVAAVPSFAPPDRGDRSTLLCRRGHWRH